MLRYCVFLGALLLPLSAVWAQDYMSPGERVIASANPLTGLQLASADGAMVTKGGGSVDVSENKSKPYKERWLTANKLHKYLGLGSLGAAGLTLLTVDTADKGENGGKVDGGLHETFARTAAGLGAAAVLTGLLFHWDDITLSNGFSDPDNLHMILTTLGALGYAQAVNKAPGDGHSGYGATGALSMALGIKMVW